MACSLSNYETGVNYTFTKVITRQKNFKTSEIKYAYIKKNKRKEKKICISNISTYIIYYSETKIPFSLSTVQAKLEGSIRIWKHRHVKFIPVCYV